SIISSSIAMSSAAMAGPGATRPSLSQLVAAHTSQNRSIWRCARSHHTNRDKMERVARTIDKYQRHPQANLRRKAEARNDWPSTSHRGPGSGCGWGWGMSRSRFSFSELSAGREKSFWKAEHERMNHRIAHLKKHIDKDPYGAIFGRRLDSTPYIGQCDTAATWPGFLRTFLGAEKPMTDHPSKAHLQDFNFIRSPAQSTLAESRDAPEFDPISGRMAPKAPKHEAQSESTMQASDVVVDCPPGSEVEAKLASNPSIVDDGQFQLGSISAAKRSKLDTQTIECPSADTGRLNPRRNVECAPGNEIEALFTAKPAARNDQSRPLEAFGSPSSINISVDCPPGSELEAKFTSELSLGSQTNKEAASIDYGPGSELEAKIVAETTRAQQSDATISCSPGSEPEALFAAKPAIVTATHYPRAPLADDGEAKKDNIIVDRGPGNELEVKLVPDAASAEMRGESDELSALQASDIRARYASLKSEDGPGTQSGAAEDMELDASEDRAGEILQSQKPSVGAQPWSSAEYRILAYDSSASTITTAEAGSFFGSSETTQPHKILSRLHNPAKFVPYFAQMEQDGYDIATGGGDILVFKRSINAPKYTSATTEQDSAPPQVNAEITKYQCHDSYDSTVSARTDHPSSTVKPSASSSSSSSSESIHESDSSSVKPKSESSFRKVFRRMILTGTIAAASCYAMGVVTEYFRTGGQDGLGADAFTAFESERRRRE
ncbi:uncharacterized protein N7482_001235, partial [Penicillium canariense]